MTPRVYRELKYGKLAFAVLMGAGYLMRPELVKQNKGVSNFWFKKRSKAVYIAGFTINSLVTLWVARQAWREHGRQSGEAKPLAVKALLAMAVLLTSPLLRTRKSKVHYIAGGVMYVAQILISIRWIAGRLNKKLAGLLFMEVFGTLLNFITATGKIQQMFLGQVLAQAGYMGLLLNTLKPRHR